MRRLILVLGVLLVILVAGDLVARAVATAELRDRARDRVAGAKDSDASIESFPFLGRLLASGTVSRVRVKVSPVASGAVTFSFVEVDLRGVRVDRGRLFRDRKVELTSLKSGKVTVELSQAEVSRLAKVPITFAPGRASVTRAGISASANLSMESGVLVLAAGPAPIRIRVPRAALQTCEATSVTVKAGAADLSCTITRIPAELLRRAQ